MAESRLARARGAGAVGLDRPALARASSTRGELAADGRRGRRHRAHVEPVDLPEGDRRRRRLRRADLASCSRAPTTRARSSSSSRSTTCATPATCCARSGSATGGRGRLRLARGRPRRSPSTRRRPSSRRSSCTTRVERPNLYIKIPATREGLPAIEDCIAARHLDQHDADLLARALRARSSPPTTAALARLVDGGGDPSKVTSVASFFVSRLDTEADARLEALGNTELAGQARDREREARLQALPGGVRRAATGSGSPRPARRVQRPLWASTSTKNPAYRDVMYVEELIGPRHGEHDAARDARGLPRPRRGARRHGARGRRRRPSSCSPTSPRPASTTTTSSQTLETEGVQKFADSFDELIAGHRGQAGRAGARL